METRCCSGDPQNIFQNNGTVNNWSESFQENNGNGRESNNNLDLHSSFLAILMVIILIGNIGLILVILTSHHLKTITNAFIISLAVSDLLVGAIVIPINFFVPTAMFQGYTTCMYAACFTIVVALSSITNIFAVTIDRYIAISQPLHYSLRMTLRVACGIVFFTWLYAGVLGLLPLMGWRVETSVCNRGETYPPYYVLLIFITGCILPAWGSAVLYVKIFILARHHQRRINHTQEATSICSIKLQNMRRPQNSTCGTSDSPMETSAGSVSSTDGWNSASNRKTLKTLVILMLYFQLSWLPVFISMVTDAFVSPRLIPSWLHSMFASLAFVNSALDPLIYGYRNREIKAATVHKLQRLGHMLCLKGWPNA